MTIVITSDKCIREVLRLSPVIDGNCGNCRLLIFPLVTEIIYVPENLGDVEARYNGRLSPDPYFCSIFKVSVFFCDFFANSQSIVA
ncbi:hypothetical protein COO91_10775 (plasmid) [Nostoc flagelliforme CCNUN1]|uniref:Uncharacterized protein n=1 Tax=Nostoc flagelliforme CCNUN1 TaxID=2038116 RepID=A0A2K8TA52_9NOSO|nr:hypothetical protein [Nostoc flagelliforme]AUB43745.1 hypothetical protein COO91_09935 [Nostoc flagelliforme CCNUN1]AUB44542.1 hypothetical protein COO91_10775 [Nostoc flagelliforme CCNUN1]